MRGLMHASFGPPGPVALGLGAGVTTKTLVENCELSLIYKNTNVLKGAVKGYDTKDKVNTLTAAAKIAF